MNRLSWLLLVSFLSCSRCENTEAPPELEKTGDNRVDEAFLSGINDQEVVDQNPTVSEPEEGENILNAPQRVYRTKKEAQGDSAFAASLKKSLEKSPNKDKSCAEILANFKLAVDKTIQAKDLKVLIAEVGNVGKDAVFQACLKVDPEFKRQYNELNEKLKSSFNEK